METPVVFFAALVLIAAALASIAIWAPRPTVIRAAAVAITAVFIPLTYLSVTDLLSKPKPIEHEWFKRHVDEATLLSVSFDEGHAIYVWLRLDGTTEPRYYRLPWRLSLAEQLQNLIDEAAHKNTMVRIRNPFALRAWDNLGDLNVEIAPPPSLPRKLPPPPSPAYDPRAKGLTGA